MTDSVAPVANSLKEDPVTEERISSLLSEAQQAMQAKKTTEQVSLRVFRVCRTVYFDVDWSFAADFVLRSRWHGSSQKGPYMACLVGQPSSPTLPSKQCLCLSG